MWQTTMCVGRQSPSVDGEQPELFAGITHHFRVEVWLPNRHGHGVGQVQRQKRRTASRLRYRARQNRPRESARDSRHPSSRTSHHRLSRARSKGKNVSKPTFTPPTVKYDTRTMTPMTIPCRSRRRRVASGVTLPFPTPTMATNGSLSTWIRGVSRKARARDGDDFFTSAFADTRTTPRETPPRTERYSGLTSASKTSLSQALPTSSADRSSPMTSASSRRYAPDSNRPGREAPTGRSNSRVVVSFAPSVTCYIERRTPS